MDHRRSEAGVAGCVGSIGVDSLIGRNFGAHGQVVGAAPWKEVVLQALCIGKTGMSVITRSGWEEV